MTLVQGLERIASFDLHSRVQDAVEAVELKKVLDHLRIMIEPSWQEMDGRVAMGTAAMRFPRWWRIRTDCCRCSSIWRRTVCARWPESPVRELEITVHAGEQRVLVFFQDSGRAWRRRSGSSSRFRRARTEQDWAYIFRAQL